MRTSATGAESGFTLVEMMVVIVIIGLMASVAIMAAPGRRSLSSEAEQFAARLHRAQEEAVLTNRPVGVAVTAQGYSFLTRTGSGWAALDDGPFEDRTWSEGVAATLRDGEKGLVTFDSTGVAEPLTVTLTRDAQRMLVSVDAGGNVRVDAAA
jgi:general secretion pathway protein H